MDNIFMNDIAIMAEAIGRVENIEVLLSSIAVIMDAVEQREPNRDVESDIERVLEVRREVKPFLDNGLI